ncbi:MAG: glycosyltransferase family 2 protein [Akkermansiaceae bacterium]
MGLPEVTYRISLVIPTYNRKDKVVRAVQSALAQTYPPYEILVIDDGSSDGTRELLENRSDIRYIYKENGGVSSARNLGIQESAGEWIAFLDSDDTWLPEKLQEQIQCLATTGGKANFTSIAEEGKAPADGFSEVRPHCDSNVHCSVSEAYDFLWKSECHPMVQTLLIEKSLLINLGCFDQSLTVAEDTALFYRICLSGQFSYTNKVLAVLERNREEHGLSDSPVPEKILQRYHCYVRVQSELFWRVLPESYPAARHALKRLGYFASRCAELECAFGNIRRCRYMAFFGMSFTRLFKDKIKSAVFLLAPRLLRASCTKKWIES